MGRERFYKPGSFYRVDERTGFVVRAERTRKEWNGHIVRDVSWEPRQPQDLVRGVVDDQTVPEPRPIAAYQFIQTANTNVAQTVANGDALSVLGNVGWLVGDALWIMQDTGDYWTAAITEIDGLTVVFAPPLLMSVSAGNPVQNLAAQARLVAA